MLKKVVVGFEFGAGGDHSNSGQVDVRERDESVTDVYC